MARSLLLAALAAAAATATAFVDRANARLLTPLLRAGRLDELRDVAKVNLPGISQTSYAGYFEVNATDNAHHFVWFWQARSGRMDAPVVVWMQGGPGSSSLFALFTENGPYRLDDNLNPVENAYSWGNDYHLLYLDNPRGTGYSFTNPGTLCTEASCYGRDFDAMIRQAMTAFGVPDNDLYITGESYGGHYVPEAAAWVMMNNAAGVLPVVNLKGIAVGNGFSDPPVMVQGYPQLMHQTGLINADQKLIADSYVANITAALNRNDLVGAYTIWDAFLNGDTTPGGAWFQNVTGIADYFNVAEREPPACFGYSSAYVTSPLVRKAIGVGNSTYNDGNTAVEIALRADVMASQKPHIAQLLDAGMQVMLYNGALDIICGAPLTELYIPTIPFKAAPQFAASQRAIWHEPTSGLVSGWARSGGNLTQVVIRGAGHISPYDQPARTQDMIGRFIQGQAWY